MKEKKNKRKQNRKILPVILVIISLVSVLAVSASASEPDCGCTIGDYGSAVVEFYQTEVTDYWKLECESCGEIRYYYEEGSFERLSDYYILEGPEGKPTYSVTYCFTNENDEDMIVFSPGRVDGLPENVTPEPTGGIVATIAKDVTSAVGVFLKGIGSTLVDFFDNVVITTNAEGQRVLSTFAGWTLAFVGIGFGAGLLRKLLKKAN